MLDWYTHMVHAPHPCCPAPVAPLEPLLLALSDAYAAAGSHVAARWCVLAALRRQPDSAEAHAKLLLLQHNAQQQQK